MGMMDSKIKRTSAKDVLRKAIAWKHGCDAQGGKPTAGPNTIALYEAIERFERETAEDRIEQEVFDDVRGEAYR